MADYATEHELEKSKRGLCLKCGHRESLQIPKQCIDDGCNCECEFPREGGLTEK